MPTRIEREYEEATGDLYAHSIKETAGDIAIAAGENTVPTGNVASPARAVVEGDSVWLLGVIEFDGANASLGFTLPQEMWPLQNVVDSCVVTDASATPTGAAGVVRVASADGVVAITMLSGTAFATGDLVELNVSFLRK